MATQRCEDVFRGLTGRESDCTDTQRQKYYAKISGPLLDLIDIQVDVPEVKFRDIISRQEAESSEIKCRSHDRGDILQEWPSFYAQEAH